jgi:hypothetical protein
VPDEAESNGEGEDGEGAEFGEQGDEHALEGACHDVTDIEKHADTHEHQTGDQAVAEGERVDRLQPVDLQMLISWIGSVIKGSTKSVPGLPPSRNITAALTEDMPMPIGIISRGSRTFRAQIDEQEAQQHQEDAPDHDLRLGGDQSGDAPWNRSRKFMLSMRFSPRA